MNPAERDVMMKPQASVAPEGAERDVMMKPQASVAPASGAKGGEIIVGYSNRTWVCPYFKWDEKTKIHCECGILCFCDNKELGEYAGRYCSDFGWGSCTLARNRNRHYEKQNAQKGK